MLRNGLQRDPMALALQTAAMLLMLLAALAILSQPDVQQGDANGRTG